MTPPALQAAMEYLRIGWSVIALKPGSKEPLWPWKRFQRERPHEKEARSWWGKEPRANVGIVTGPVSGVMVLDVDGPEGLRAIKGRSLPPTVTSSTGRGLHYFYRLPPLDLKNAVRLLPGLDLRVQGGYVVAPPSLHPCGRRYEWTKGLSPWDLDLACPPGWLLELAAGLPARIAAIGRTARSVAPNGFAPRPDYQKLLDGVYEGMRNDTACRLAGHLLARGLPKEEVRLLLEGWNRLNDPPLADKELFSVFQSIASRHAANGSRGLGDTAAHPEAPRTFCVPVGRILKARLPKTGWLVEPLLEAGSIGFIGGEPKLAKSWLALHLALCLAAKKPFLGHFRVLHKKRVLYLEEEDSPILVQRRLKWLLCGLALKRLSDGRLHLAIRSGFKVDEPVWRKKLEEEISSFKPDLVVVDALNRVHSRDENSQVEMSRVMQGFEETRRRFGCAFLIVHHFHKSSVLSAGRSGGQRLRGSSVLASWSENSLFITGKARGFYRVGPESKGAEVPPFLFSLDDASLKGRPGLRLVYRGEAARNNKPRGPAGRLPLFRWHGRPRQPPRDCRPGWLPPRQKMQGRQPGIFP